ncbi:MAG: phosphotransferase [Rhodospirillaceae bacterium]|nr:phosphotransferase [Rhodospirillaceae bacterium]
MTAIERLRALPLLSAQPTIRPIDGGRTNENFRVESGGRTYFARVGIDLPHHGITRVNEMACHRRAAALGIAPEVVHGADGIMVTAFIDGRTLVQGESIDDATLGRLAKTLRRLGDEADASGLPIFDPVAICRRDLAALPIDGLSGARRREASDIIAAAPRLSNHALIHADLIPENVIVSGERVMLVDWEYAGRGDPAVDIAAVALHFGLGEPQRALVVEAHDGVSAKTVEALQPVLALREALWCEVQKRFAGIRGDLAEYTEMCWRRLEGRAR